MTGRRREPTFAAPRAIASREENRNQIATVSYYQYEHYDPAGLQPGASVTWWFGPWDWIKKGVVVTAQPFDLSTADRALEVTNVWVRTTPASPTGDEWVYATIRNVGQDPIVIYYISLVEIAP